MVSGKKKRVNYNVLYLYMYKRLFTTKKENNGNSVELTILNLLFCSHL